jgi:uncharacterized damage-inducible protein DinB
MNLCQIFSHWKQVRMDLLVTIDKFEEADLSYIPFAGSWPVGQMMLHIADAEDGWIRYAVTRELDHWPEQYRLENYPTKAAIKSALTAVHNRTEQYLETLEEAGTTQLVAVPWGESLPLLWIIWHVVEHEIHHRGELSLILGLLGREGLDV